jgi:hypothetical protein
MRRVFATILVLFSFALAAQEGESDSNKTPSPEPPDIPEPVQSGEALEPDITIIRRERQTIEEYRVNGRLYMVKIIPKYGPPYYLLDSDGDGNMDVRRSDLERGMQVPQWVIFSW